jgi:hypothetical protein
MSTLNACAVAKTANHYAKAYQGNTITSTDCNTIQAQVASKFDVSGSSVRVFVFNPQSQSTTDTTAWNITAKSSNVTSTSESVIPRPELLGCPGRNVPGCPSKSSSAQRTSATTGQTTFYGVGQVKDANNCTLQQVLKIAVVQNA